MIWLFAFLVGLFTGIVTTTSVFRDERRKLRESRRQLRDEWIEFWNTQHAAVQRDGARKNGRFEGRAS
jgi:hypothetical protein